MFSPLSRGSSRAGKSYVCSSCLCSLFNTAEPPLLRIAGNRVFQTRATPPRSKPFSTTPHNGAAKGKAIAKKAGAGDTDRELEAAIATLGKRTAAPTTKMSEGEVTITEPQKVRIRRRGKRAKSLALQDKAAAARVEVEMAESGTASENHSSNDIIFEDVEEPANDDDLSQKAKKKTISTPEKAPKVKKKTLTRRVVSQNDIREEGQDKVSIEASDRSAKRSAKSSLKKTLMSMLNGDSAEKAEPVEVVKKRSLPTDAEHHPIREAVGKAKFPTRIKRSSLGKDKGDRRTLKKALKGVTVKRKLSSPSVRRLQLQFETHLGERAEADEPIPLKTKKGTIRHEIETINTADLNLVPVDKPQPPVPALSYGLERVLFNPGVYHLQDPRSRVFNFDPYLQEIMPVSEFDFTLLKRFITSSRDKALLQVAAEQGSKYTGSTSSMTSALSHFHYLLSQWRPPNTGILSKDFPVEFRSFTQLQRGPSAIFLRYKDGVYAIDADKQFDTANVLSMLGQSMEKLLTLSTEDFEKYRKSSSETVSDEARNEPESYHYTTMGDFLMRSQLDAYDPRIPGTGMFDLKTRAVVSIRMDVSQYEEGSGYEIRGRHGQWESFEREYYDMIRAAFLKYSLQVRMGRMDGIFVAYHNTERIFGFQYISLPEMDYALHGTDNRKLGDEEFKLSLDLMNRVLDRATAKYPKQSLRLHFETRGKADEATYMYIFARPIREEVIEEIQNTNKAKIEEFEKNVLHLHTETEEETEAEWKDLREKVEQSMDLDETDTGDKQDAHDTEHSTPVDDDLIDEEEDNEEEDDALVDEDQDNEEDDDLVDEEADDEDEVEMEVEVFESNVEEDLEDEDLINEQTTGGVDMDELTGSELSSEEQESLPTEASQTESSAELADGEEPRETIDVFEHDQKEDEEPGFALDKPEKSDIENEESLNEEATKLENAETENVPNDESDLTGSDSAPKISQPTEDAEHGEDNVDHLHSLLKDDNTTTSKTAQEADADDEANPSELMAMYLTIRNKVDGVYVRRPEKLDENSDWKVEYALAEIDDKEKAITLYNALRRRRRQILVKTDKDKDNQWNNRYINSIKAYNARGREFRKHMKEIQAKEPLKVLYVEPLAKPAEPSTLKNKETWTENGEKEE